MKQAFDGVELEEADIIINGHELSFAQSMTVRVALSLFSESIDNMSEDINTEKGKHFRNMYKTHIEAIAKMFY